MIKYDKFKFNKTVWFFFSRFV